MSFIAVLSGYFTGNHLPPGICTWFRQRSSLGELKSGRTKASGVNRNHWSASTVSNNTTNAWRVNLSNGNTNNNNKTNSNYVRCVRLGMGSIIPRLSRPFPKNPLLFAYISVCRLLVQSSLSVCRSGFATGESVV